MAFVGECASAAPARAQEIGYSVAFSFARAGPPTERLDGLYIFNSVDVTEGRVRIWASVPFIRQRTLVETLDPATGLVSTVEQARDGFGDPLLRMDVQLHKDRTGSLQVAVAAAVKPAVVDAAAGLGTGETDVAVGGSVFKAIGPTSVFVDVLFWKYGDPEGVEFQDTVAYSVGLGRILGSRGRWSSMVSLAGFSNGGDGGPAPMQLNVAALALVGRHSLSIGAAVGMNDSSSDFSVATGWRVSF